MLGAAVGIAGAAAVAWLWSRYGHRVNLALFFQVTAIFLLVFVVQLFIRGIHEMSEQNFLPYSAFIHDSTEAGARQPVRPSADLPARDAARAWLIIKRLDAEARNPLADCYNRRRGLEAADRCGSRLAGRPQVCGHASQAGLREGRSGRRILRAGHRQRGNRRAVSGRGTRPVLGRLHVDRRRPHPDQGSPSVSRAPLASGRGSRP